MCTRDWLRQVLRFLFREPNIRSRTRTELLDKTDSISYSSNFSKTISGMGGFVSRGYDFLLDRNKNYYFTLRGVVRVKNVLINIDE